MFLNYYDWLDSQYSFGYPDLYTSIQPLVEDELNRYSGTNLTPYQIDQLVDNIMNRYDNMYSQTQQYRDRNFLRNFIFVLLFSRLLRRRRYPIFRGYY